MNLNNALDRRKFLKLSSMFAVAVSATPLGACRDGADDSDMKTSTCRTTDDILGPFYKAGAPFTENVIPEGAEVSPLIVRGIVFEGCDTPVPDAIVEIWNADEEGSYDTSDQYRYRGRYRSSQDGDYFFQTIIPGKYLNGQTYRPSHIHFRITAPGYKELVSQIYFTNDPDIPTDPWANADKAKERILTVEEGPQGIDMVIFDIHLERET
jgi:catechol 1,2-dioxygenase